MTQTAEERAAKVVDEIMDQIMSLIQINGEPIMSVDVLNPAPALIAQALREAEAGAYEKAAVWAEGQAKETRRVLRGMGVGPFIENGFGKIMEAIPRDIRKLALNPLETKAP